MPMDADEETQIREWEEAVVAIRHHKIRTMRVFEDGQQVLEIDSDSFDLSVGGVRGDVLIVHIAEDK
jgi:hypothetical protein